MTDKSNTKKPWQFDLEQYIRQGEAGKAEKGYAWKTAIGLQDVDGYFRNALVRANYNNLTKGIHHGIFGTIF